MSNGPTNDDEFSGGVSGRVVLVVLFVLALLTVASAVTFIRRPPGSPPANVENRPFGPATPAEQAEAERERLDQPLLYRGSGSLEPEPTRPDDPARP